MLLFFLSLAILILGYRFYSPFVERQAGIDPSTPTPSNACMTVWTTCHWGRAGPF